MVLITAPIAVSTVSYPGEDFQVLKVLGQAWLFYNKRVSGAAQRTEVLTVTATQGLNLKLTSMTWSYSLASFFHLL